jgi:hypothetical protein
MRNSSDYVDFFETTLDDAQKQVENAKLFLSAVETYLHQRREASLHDGTV